MPAFFAAEPPTEGRDVLPAPPVFARDAVAPLRKSVTAGAQIWHCAACNYRVRLQVVADIRGKTGGAIEGMLRALAAEVVLLLAPVSSILG